MPIEPDTEGHLEMAIKKIIRCRRGLSLVNTMVTVTILSVAVIGSSSFRYCAALDSRRAAKQVAAAQIAVLLCESWRAVEGIETYDPVAHLGTDLELTENPDAPGNTPTGFTTLGGYTVTLNGADFYATLSWNDVDAGLRAINVTVAWAQRDSNADDTDKAFQLTAYTLTAN
jgi:Tfp pilus assembly protein PilV